MERKRAESLAELAELFATVREATPKQEPSDAYRPRPTDVIITPYGKSGTTWTQQIFHTLRTRGDMDFDDISRVVPWIEANPIVGLDINAEQRANPRGFKSHQVYEKLPRGCRYINVIRNPVDVAYSAFKFMEGWYFEPGSIGADEFVGARMAEAEYHKHLISWWEHRNDDDVLYLVYEHMKQDLPGTIKAIAAFSDIKLDDELLALTETHASLPFMQRHKDRFDDAMMRARSEETMLPAGSDSAKVRDGQVGKHEIGAHIIVAMQALWREHVTPVTGFDDYQTLIDSLAT